MHVTPESEVKGVQEREAHWAPEAAGYFQLKYIDIILKYIFQLGSRWKMFPLATHSVQEGCFHINTKKDESSQTSTSGCCSHKKRFVIHRQCLLFLVYISLSRVNAVSFCQTHERKMLMSKKNLLEGFNLFNKNVLHCLFYRQWHDPVIWQVI